MRKLLVVLAFLLASATAAVAQVSVQIGVPVVSIGINVPVYPHLVRVQGYPVYYAPRLHANYFFYDGLYWVYRRGNWYASHWYNGPWSLVEPDGVPVYLLRVPVRYYYDRPALFTTWYVDAAPHWGEVWGYSWEQRNSGWNQWNRNAVVAAAPLPVYQRQYAGNRYPRVEQQQALQTQNYRYQPREAVARQFYQARGAQVASVAPQVRQLAVQSRMGAQQTTAAAQQMTAAAQQMTAAAQQSTLRNEVRARQHEARVARSQELAATQARERTAAAQSQVIRATRQHPEQMVTQQAPQPRQAKASKHGPEQVVMRQEQQSHGNKHGAGGGGGHGGGNGGDHHGGKGDKGPKGGKG